MKKGQKMPEEVKKRISQTEKGKLVSFKTRKKISQSMLGQTEEKCRNWIGDDVGYCGIHDWLKKNFGNPQECEQCGKSGDYNKARRWNIHWAKLRDKLYERKRENFWALCHGCHISYDMNQEKRRKISESLKLYYSNR